MEAKTPKLPNSILRASRSINVKLKALLRVLPARKRLRDPVGEQKKNFNNTMHTSLHRNQQNIALHPAIPFRETRATTYRGLRFNRHSLHSDAHGFSRAHFLPPIPPCCSFSSAARTNLPKLQTGALQTQVSVSKMFTLPSTTQILARENKNCFFVTSAA